MLFGLVLVVATAVVTVVAPRSPWRTRARRAMAAAMVVAGLAHLFGPDPFVQHIPGWVPGRLLLVYATGVVEIGLGLALVGPAVRQQAAGAALALYLMAVWPANIYVAVAGVDVDGQPGGPYPWVRLPFQVLFVAWAWWSTHPPTPRAVGRTPVAVVTGSEA